MVKKIISHKTLFITPEFDGGFSGGTIYNQQIAKQLSNCEIIYVRDFSHYIEQTKFKNCTIIIDAWCLHEINPNSKLPMHYLLVHHPLALDNSVENKTNNEAIFWDKAEGIIVTGKQVQVFVSAQTSTPILLIEPGVELLSKKTQYNKHVKNIVSIGAFIPRKGDELLLIALSQIKQNFNLIRIGSVPNSSYFEKLQALLIEYKLEQKVQFLVNVDAKKKNEILQNADLAVFPTQYESYGMAIQECLNMDLPCLVSDFDNLKNQFGDEGVRYLPLEVKLWSEAISNILAKNNFYSTITEEIKNQKTTFNNWAEQAAKIQNFISK